MIKNTVDLRRNEHEVIREKVGFYDFTHEVLEVNGSDAGSFLDKMFVNNISGADVGEGKYTTMLNESGSILDDVIIFRIEDDRYWVVTLYSEQMLSCFAPHADDYSVNFINLKEDTVMYAIQGPKSLEVVNNILAENVTDLKFNRIVNNEIDGVPVRVARCGFTGEIGYELHFAPEHVDFVKDKLYESGKPFGIIELTTDVTLSSLPTEKGLKIMRDLEGLNPVEAGLGWTVDYSKDFVGKEATLKSKEQGPERSLIGFQVEDADAEVELLSDIKLNGKVVGTVTNYTYGFSVEKNIGYAIIDNSLTKIGDKVKIGDKEIDAELTQSKFFDMKDKRRRGIYT